MGHNLRYIDLLLNFGILSMSPEWLQLQTSNLVGTLPIHSILSISTKLRHGVKTRSRGYILNLRIAVNG